MSLALPITLAAQAAQLAGNWPQAQAHADHGMRLAERLGERMHMPALLIEQARIAIGQGRLEAGCATLHEAALAARAQQALWPELMALAALCETAPRSMAHRRALEAAHRRLQEGHATPLAAKVRRLLGRQTAANA